MKSKIIEQSQKILINASKIFIDHGYNKNTKVFFSDLDNQGIVTSQNIHIIALSRLIYGFSYSSKYNNSYLKYAKECVDFLLKNMICSDENGQYFLPTYSLEKGPLPAEELNIWEQSYGFCGLVEYVRVTNDISVLKAIRELMIGYINRFKDPENKGFCFNYSFKNGSDYESKAFQTVIYPCSSFFGGLWEVDADNRKTYEVYLKELFELAYENLWNDETQWVNAKFNRHWEVLPNDAVCPGHNFQLGWFMMKTQSFNFLTSEEKEKYTSFGETIIKTTLKKDILIDMETKGFPESINPMTNEINSSNRSWWEHAEVINALTFLDDSYLPLLASHLDYFENTFVDYEYGGEYASVDTFGQPVSNYKGGLGKANYHTIEMLKLVMTRLQ